MAALSLAAANGRAVAQASAKPLTIDKEFAGSSLGFALSIFEDASGKLDYESVGRLASSSFKPAQADVPTFGFSRSAFWLRFDVDNRLPHDQRWLLEVGYPPLDFLDLYAPATGGTVRHAMSGDQRPFHSRDIAYRNVVFEVVTPPGTYTHYLRVETSGPVTIPLRAWTERAFLDAVNASNPPLWMFYGWMIVMGLYNLFLFFAIRDLTYLHYVSYLVSFTLFESALNGLAFQYLWPEATWWLNSCNPALIGLCCATAAQFLRSFTNTREIAPRFHRWFGLLGWCGGAVTVVLALIGPTWLRMRVAVGLALTIAAAGAAATVWMAARGQRQARYFLAAWLLFATGVGLYLLTSIGVLSVTPLTEWTIQFGAAAEVALLSLGLADRINVMRRNLGKLNLQLEQNIVRLTDALDRAEQARRAKNAFLASVSHELRTPLNAIINIPEAILEWFRHSEVADCAACHARFELDPGEHVDASTTCPECGQPALQQARATFFEGDAASAAGHLAHVQRAGTHLLEVVTDILDVSKLEAGRMSLTLERVDLNHAVRDALEPMRDFAATQGVTLQLPDSSEAFWVRGDKLRLKQILLNLVSNAIKFSDSRGTVRVSVVDEPASYRIGVHDQGIGVRDEDKPRIFEGFEQGTSDEVRRFGGTGLGLSITKRLVTLHDGEIWFDSTVGKGSDFYVRLPKAAEHPMPVSTPPAFAESASGSPS